MPGTATPGFRATRRANRCSGRSRRSPRPGASASKRPPPLHPATARAGAHRRDRPLHGAKQVGDVPSVYDANDLRAAADRLDQGRSRHPSRHPGRPTATPRLDPVSDSVTPQEVLGHLVDEETAVASGEGMAPLRTCCALRAIPRAVEYRNDDQVVRSLRLHPAPRSNLDTARAGLRDHSAWHRRNILRRRENRAKARTGAPS
jgi:hypothetical protein